MDLSFTTIISFVSTYFFGGSTYLAGLALLVLAWMFSLIILINMKASPAYSVVPMIPLAIFFRAYGILDETIMVLIIIISAVLVAQSFKRMWD